MATHATNGLLSLGPVSLGHVSLESVRALLGPHPAPCLSLYMPTHRHLPDNTVDLPAFRHLVSSLQMALSATQPLHEVDRLLHPFHLLEANQEFWQHTRDGLAVLAADGRAEVFLLQRPVKPLALVTSRFHTMPLLRTAASTDRFHLLTLTSRMAHVYEGLATDDGIERLDPVPLHDVTADRIHPEALDITRGEAIDQETFQPHRVQRGMGPAGLGAGSIVHGGAGSKQDDIDADTEIFLRHVDEVVHERVTKHTGLPLVLAALPRLAAAFRGLSKNRFLLAEGILRDVHLVPDDALPDLVAPLFAGIRAARITHDVQTFMQARPRDLGSGDLSDIARAAVAGRVATLLIEKDRFEPGWLDPATGAIAGDGEVPPDLSRSGDQPAIQTADLFNAVAETVLVHGGGIVAMEKNAMPTESGVAAIYRYSF
jgi:hypothetical protein